MRVLIFWYDGNDQLVTFGESDDLYNLEQKLANISKIAPGDVQINGIVFIIEPGPSEAFLIEMPDGNNIVMWDVFQSEMPYTRLPLTDLDQDYKD